MTSSTGGAQPPSTIATPMGRPFGTGEQSATDRSKKDAVIEEAAGLGSKAVETGAHVAATAVDQARNLAAEATTQARDLACEARTQLRDQTAAQKEKAAGSLRAFAAELRSMANQTPEGGVAADLARQAADRTRVLATWIEQRDAGGILDEARQFARRRPGMFLLGAALAGVAAGRLTRGITDTVDSPAAATAVPVRPTPPSLPRPASEPFPLHEYTNGATYTAAEATASPTAMVPGAPLSGARTGDLR